MLREPVSTAGLRGMVCGSCDNPYTMAALDELVVDYQATTDQATPVNLTQHSYFNLAGEAAGTVEGHRLQLQAGRPRRSVAAPRPKAASRW